MAPNVCIYITLWYLGNQEPFRTVSDKFGVSISTIYYVLIEVTTWLCTISPQHIKWPKNNNEKAKLQVNLQIHQNSKTLLDALMDLIYK